MSSIPEPDPSLKPWRVTNSMITYQDRWLKVRSDTCVTEDGQIVTPFHVLEYGDWINIVPVLDDGRVLLCHEYRHAVGQVALGLMGGAVDTTDGHDRDSALLAAAHRELREEAGLYARDMIPVLSAWANAASHSNTVTTYLAVGLSVAGDPVFDLGERVATVPASLPAILKDLRAGALKMQGLHIAALNTAAQHILSEGKHNPALTHARQALLEAIKAWD